MMATHRPRWEFGPLTWFVFGCAVLAVAAAILAVVATTVRGAALPVPVLHARVVSVSDGDTVRAIVDLGLEGLRADVRVRLAGVDAPETKGKCPEETASAERAKRTLAEFVTPGSTVALMAPIGDKYAGRLVARMVLADGTDVATRLLARGVVRPYTGQGQRGSWCPNTTSTTSTSTTTTPPPTVSAAMGRS